jgi:hypothetical protein
VIASAVGLGSFFFILAALNKPLYISPLASRIFAQSHPQESKLDLLKKTLQSKGIEYKEVTKDSEAVFTVVLKDGSRVTFSSQKDIITQIASLQYILSHLTMEGKLFSRLDLRFDKPVIVLK